MYRHFLKALIDITLSVLGLIILAIPMLIIALVIKCDSKGPALFKQKRLGKGQKEFTVYKFRTMCDHAFEKVGWPLLNMICESPRWVRYCGKPVLTSCPRC